MNTIIQKRLNNSLRALRTSFPSKISDLARLSVNMRSTIFSAASRYCLNRSFCLLGRRLSNLQSRSGNTLKIPLKRSA